MENYDAVLKHNLKFLQELKISSISGYINEDIKVEDLGGFGFQEKEKESKVIDRPDINSIEGQELKSSSANIQKEDFGVILDQVKNENSILKRAVVYLQDLIMKFGDVERENLELKELIGKEKLNNYLIRLQLMDVLKGFRDIETDKEIF